MCFAANVLKLLLVYLRHVVSTYCHDFDYAYGSKCIGPAFIISTLDIFSHRASLSALLPVTYCCVEMQPSGDQRPEVITDFCAQFLRRLLDS